VPDAGGVPHHALAEVNLCTAASLALTRSALNLGRVGLERIAGGCYIAAEPVFDGFIGRQEDTQAIADHYAFRGVLSGSDLGPDRIGHLVRQRDAELLGRAHGDLGEGEPDSILRDPGEVCMSETKAVGYSRTLPALLTAVLGLPAERVYIEISAPPAHLFGWNGRTF